MKRKPIIITATVARLLLGWFMLIDGLQIVFTQGWSSSGFLMSAKTFPTFYSWFAQPQNLWWVDPLNSWGITLIGVSLLLGIGLKPASWAGVVMMILYYFPHNAFPTVPHGYIVEEHIIYAGLFAFIAVLPEAQVFGLSSLVKNTFLGKVPVVRNLI